MPWESELQPAPAPGGRIGLGRSRNCRDVGGRVAGAGAVRRHLLFRSDLPVVDEGSVHELESLRLRTVVDLREPDERAARPAELASVPMQVLAMPLGLGPIVAADPSKGASLSALYRAAILEAGHRVAAVVSALAQPDALPALVHCAAGKDRTGIVVGVLLSALGVSDEEVARDYQLSASNLDAEFFAALDVPMARQIQVDLTTLQGATSEEMLRMLALVRSVAGSARDYLTSHGVSAEELAALDRQLVTRDAPDR